MITFNIKNRTINDVLSQRFAAPEVAVFLDVYVAEFDDVRYRIQASEADANSVLLSIAVPHAAPPELLMTSAGLPLGAIESVQEEFGAVSSILPTPESGYNLTLLVDLTRLPPEPEARAAMAGKLAALRATVMGAPLRALFAPLAEGRGPGEEGGILTAMVHRQGEVFFALPGPDRVTVLFPMRFRDTQDAVLACAFLQELVEARRTGGLSSAPLCAFTPPSAPPPMELKDAAPAHVAGANAGFVAFVVQRQHVEGPRLAATAWSLGTFYAYVAYHVKCAKGFMHTRMRRRIELMNQALTQSGTPQQGDRRAATSSSSFGVPLSPLSSVVRTSALGR